MVFDLFLRVGPAIISIFKLGYEPKREMFHELTAEQYAKLEEEGEDISKKWFTLLADDPKYEVSELLVVNESDIESLLDAVKYIDRLCAKNDEAANFKSFQDKLKYAASVLPGVFSEDTPYAKAKQSNLKVVK